MSWSFVMGLWPMGSPARRKPTLDLSSPLPSGADRWEFPGQAGGQGDWTGQSCVNQGQDQGTKDKETTDQGPYTTTTGF